MTDTVVSPVRVWRRGSARCLIRAGARPVVAVVVTSGVARAFITAKPSHWGELETSGAS